MAEYDVDLFVIGAGSGGVRAARIAAGHGARVAVAEEWRIGGTCVLRGCVPKKLLVYASRFADDFEDAAGFGWTIEGARFSWPALIAAKDKEISRLSEIYERNLVASGVAIHRSRAVLDGPHAVRLDDGRKITARHVLVATGARPVRLAIPGAELALTSNEIFDLPALPASIAIVGAGYIAVEFAALLQRLGCAVTLVHRGAKILRGFDEDLRDLAADALRAAGVRLLLQAEMAELREVADGVEVVFTDGGVDRFGAVMFASGRAPNVEGLGLESLGVLLDQVGAVRVDAFSQTTVPWIHAVGDVTNRLNLTPIAIREGHAFADTVFGDRPTMVDHKNVPTGVFLTPEIGTVGLSETEARSRYPQLDIYKTSFRPMKATLSGRNERVFMKIVVDAASDRVLGVHILGEDAAEMVQTVAIAVKLGATKADFDATVALHPSSAEELVTMRVRWTPPEAALPAAASAPAPTPAAPAPVPPAIPETEPVLGDLPEPGAEPEPALDEEPAPLDLEDLIANLADMLPSAGASPEAVEGPGEATRTHPEDTAAAKADKPEP